MHKCTLPSTVLRLPGAAAAGPGPHGAGEIPEAPTSGCAATSIAVPPPISESGPAPPFPASLIQTTVICMDRDGLAGGGMQDFAIASPHPHSCAADGGGQLVAMAGASGLNIVGAGSSHGDPGTGGADLSPFLRLSANATAALVQTSGTEPPFPTAVTFPLYPIPATFKFPIFLPAPHTALSPAAGISAGNVGSAFQAFQAR